MRLEQQSPTHALRVCLRGQRSYKRARKAYARMRLLGARESCGPWLAHGARPTAGTTPRSDIYTQRSVHISIYVLCIPTYSLCLPQSRNGGHCGALLFLCIHASVNWRITKQALSISVCWSPSPTPACPRTPQKQWSGNWHNLRDRRGKYRRG